MKLSRNLIRLSLLVLLSAAFYGCASESELTAIRLDTDHPLYKTEACQQSIKDGERHKELRSARVLLSPVLVVMSGGLLLPLVAANVGMDTVDHVDASNMATRCGGKGKTGSEITESVVKGATLGIVTGLPGK
jgi:hypothetical protein